MGRQSKWIAPLALATVLFSLWIVLTSNLPHYLLPHPAQVVQRLVYDLAFGDILPTLAVTLLESFGGCLLGALVGIPLGIGIHRSKWISAAVNPFLGATQAIPAIALAPLLVLWIGYGPLAVIALCALMVFFPILISTVVGLRHVPQQLIDAALLDGVNSRQLLWNVEIPIAASTILAGLRNGFTLSVTGAVVGEMVMGGRGLGMLLTVQRDGVDTAGMFATIIVLCMVAATIYSLIHLIERKVRITL